MITVRLMHVLAIILELLSATTWRDLWVVTYVDESSAQVVNVGKAFIPDGANYVYAEVQTISRRRPRNDAALMTTEFVEVRCRERQYRVRFRTVFSSDSDPVKARLTEPFAPVTVDPQREAQADILCAETPRQLTGFGSLTEFIRGYRSGPR